MTDPIDTARQEGIALGLAMAGAEARKIASRYADACHNCAMEEGGREASRLAGYASGAIERAAEAILAQAAIPPHVAAARVLLDDLERASGTDVSIDGLTAGRRWNAALEATNNQRAMRGIRAALEQIAGGE
jgi:hypothetical protein